MTEIQKSLNRPGVLTWVFSFDIMPWLKQCSWGFKAGLLLGGAHFLLFVLNTIYTAMHPDGRWHLYWILCGYIDFPVSLVLTQVILPVFYRGGPFQDPFMSTNASTLMVFSLFYAIMGTAWYFLLPILIEKACKKIANTGRTHAGVIALAVIPIFAHWLQLFRFVTGETDLFVPGLYSILPAVWTVVLVWLYFATARRKAVWGLLILAPFVYFYFVRDLYYYLKLTGR
jgi:hypothetical protein